MRCQVCCLAALDGGSSQRRGGGFSSQPRQKLFHQRLPLAPRRTHRHITRAGRRVKRNRTLLRRRLHSLGFEGGLTLLLLPLVAWWLKISWRAALATNLGLFVFFFVYALVFQWGFDVCLMCRIPQSKPQSSGGADEQREAAMRCVRHIVIAAFGSSY
jgi:Na+-transporting NADH:ubiquinone oxidoreductase subunit NqrB